MNSEERNCIEKVMLLLSIGITESIKEGALEISDAEFLLYSPRVLSLLEKCEFSEEIINLVHLGSELDDITDLVPSKFDDSLTELTMNAMNAIKKMPPIKTDIPRWTEKHLA
ncbi:hypothetical protein WH95_01245 [Kiloniella litopenaei]|uniref:DUF3969 family protein n=1 Tax=Kiloniella litopenaei TaxID=1549748 RepID=A0A0M2RAQ8_9PROT|nr:DUF3969 family protein [Kiloniella litopenaei]KKJ78731.1 hypothetical protein WH95_01245 [Kiloniella litopenaei]